MGARPAGLPPITCQRRCKKERDRLSRLNAALIKRTGSRVDQATVEQLKKLIQLLERWKARSYDGKR